MNVPVLVLERLRQPTQPLLVNRIADDDQVDGAGVLVDVSNVIAEEAYPNDSRDIAGDGACSIVDASTTLGAQIRYLLGVELTQTGRIGRYHVATAPLLFWRAKYIQ